MRLNLHNPLIAVRFGLRYRASAASDAAHNLASDQQKPASIAGLVKNGEAALPKAVAFLTAPSSLNTIQAKCWANVSKMLFSNETFHLMRGESTCAPAKCNCRR